MAYYFGIDFGTTNSAVVGLLYIDNKLKPPIKCSDKNDSEGRPVPSIVAIDNDGNVYTGRDAWNKKLQLQESCMYFHSIKSI